MSEEQTLKLARVVNGNQDAERFVIAWHQWCHLIDDLVDKDRVVAADERGRILVQFIMELAGNPFFLQYRLTLLPLMVQAINAWVDSDLVAVSLPPATLRERITRDVLKGYWHEVIWQVAFITGGWPAMREVSDRNYDFEADTETEGGH